MRRYWSDILSRRYTLRLKSAFHMFLHATLRSQNPLGFVLGRATFVNFGTKWTPFLYPFADREKRVYLSLGFISDSGTTSSSARLRALQVCPSVVRAVLRVEMTLSTAASLSLCRNFLFCDIRHGIFLLLDDIISSYDTIVVRLIESLPL